MAEENEKPVYDHASVERDRDHLLAYKSLIIVASLADKIPEIGTAPFVYDDKSIYIYSSQLSRHTRALIEEKKAQFMLCQDEADAQNIWARHRLKFTADITEIVRDDPQFTVLCDKFEVAHGPTMRLIRDFADFHMLRLVPITGVLVLGFAKAFKVEGPEFEIVTHIDGA